MLIYSRWPSISSWMSTHAGGKNCLPYSIEESSLLDALVFIGSSLILSVNFSVSLGDEIPLYAPFPSWTYDEGPKPERKVLFKGSNLNAWIYNNRKLLPHSWIIFFLMFMFKENVC